MAYQGLENKTPFAAELALLADEEGRDVLLVLVKATYRITGQGFLDLAEEQIPVNLPGEYYGEPGKTSLKYAPEANFAKLGTDIALIGHAHSPDGCQVTQLDVSLTVGSVAKVVRVFGNRVWQCDRSSLATSWVMSKPLPFTSMPLIYERAFGGVDGTPDDECDKDYESRNPVGTGLIAKNSKLADVPLPNIEDPRQLIQRVEDRPAPAGFGFISPEWEPRKVYAGTYDKAWQTSRMPLLPKDFDRRFLSAAHSDLLTKGYLRGDEPVEIINASPLGKLNFLLPGHIPEISVTMADEFPAKLETQLDSLIISTDENTVQLLWRGSMDVYNRIYDLEKIETSVSGNQPQSNNVAA